MGKYLKFVPDPDMSFRTPDGVLVQYMVVDKELATIMLNANTKNRRESDRWRRQYVRSLENDDWVFTGDPLRFGEDNLLLDGQHRLKAVEESGKSAPFLVLSDLPNSVQAYIDAGRKRTSSDQLHIEGHANSMAVAAVGRFLFRWERWRTEGQDPHVLPGNAEILKYVKQHLDEIQSSVIPGTNVYLNLKRGDGGGPSPAAIRAAYVRGLQVTKDPFLVANFFNRLAVGENLNANDPILQLRNRFLRDSDLSREEVLFFTVKAWNAEMRGEAIGKLQLPKGGVTVTRFPDMIAPGSSGEYTEEDIELAKALEQLAGSGK